MNTKTSTLVYATILVFAASLLGMMATRPAHAGPFLTVFTVNDPADTADPFINGTCDTSLLPGPQCTLRAAIQESNAVALPAVIKFDISGPGPHVIHPASKLPDITKSVIIDGYSEPDSDESQLAPSVVVDGSALMLSETGLNVAAGANNATIRGLVIQNFGGYGVAVWANGAHIEGNLIGTDVSGSVAEGNEGGGTLLAGSNNVVGGVGVGQRNVLSGNGQGVAIAGSPGGTGNKVVGNYIGTNKAGTSAIPGQSSGVRLLFLASGNHIGGPNPGEGNLISGNESAGLQISAPNNFVEGNLIGTDKTGGAPVPNGVGTWLVLADASGNTIGGTTSPYANLIAFNTKEGILMSATDGTGNAFLANSIHSNGGLGIDTRVGQGTPGDGPNQNDFLDADSGANGVQNYPVFESAVRGIASTRLVGNLHSKPNTTFRVEVFANESCDSSGYGEGQARIWSGVMASDAAGGVSIDILTVAEAGQFITATASGPDGTSEFSPCIEAEPESSPTSTPTPAPTQSPASSATPTPSGSGPTPTQTPAPNTSPQPIGTATTTPITTATPASTQGPTVSPTPDSAQQLIWGDHNCLEGPNPVDALITLRFDAGLSTNTGACPALGDDFEIVGASGHVWGDVDCGNSVNPVDALKLLRFDAGLGVTQAGLCPLIGEGIDVLL